MNILAWFNPTRWLILLGLCLALAAGYAAWAHHERDIGRAEVQMKWDAQESQRRAEIAQELIDKAKESKRRLERQEENQRAQNATLAAARADRDRNAADADKLRQQATGNARDWAARLRDSPSVAECAAGGDAIGVFTDVLGRADRRAGVLAEVADTARARGLKCEADYDSLTNTKGTP